MPSKDTASFEADVATAESVFSGEAAHSDKQYGQRMLEWVRHFLDQHEDALAYRAAKYAERLERDRASAVKTEALEHLARIATRLGRDGEAKSAMNRLKGFKQRYEALQAEVKALKLAREAAAPARADSEGEVARYRHPTFGEATLLSRSDDRLKLEFEDGTVRTLQERFVTRVVRG